MPRGVGFENAPFGHAEQNRFGPFGIFMETPFAARATTNLARVHKLEPPGFEELVNLTLIGIHNERLPQPGSGVERHETPGTPNHGGEQNSYRFGFNIQIKEFESNSDARKVIWASKQISFQDKSGL